MFAFWKTRRARRAATAAILPFVDGTRQRLGVIPDSIWDHPYVIGFVATLITLLATHEAGSLDVASLASIQSGAWVRITNMPGHRVGEEICFLSTAQDAMFMKGCRDAEAFLDASRVLEQRFAEPLDAGADFDGARDLWARYFDDYLCERRDAGEF
jgi:hypothetical protein